MRADNLTNIQSQIAKLQKRAERIKIRAKRSVLNKVRELIREYDIGADELGFNSGAGRQKRLTPGAKRPGGAKKASRAKKVAFRKDELTWSGGRGVKPKWVKDILDKHGEAGLEKYRV